MVYSIYVLLNLALSTYRHIDTFREGVKKRQMRNRTEIAKLSLSFIYKTLTSNYYFKYHIKNLKSIKCNATNRGNHKNIYNSAGFSNNFCSIINRNKLFFIDRLRDKKINLKENRKIHQKQIIDVYINWKENFPIIDIPSSEPFEQNIKIIDLITFEPSKCEIKIIGTIIPYFNEQKPIEDTSKEEWALFHIKNGGYNKTFNLLLSIYTVQVRFNSNIRELRQKYREQLKEIIGNDINNTEENIDLLTRYCLFKIVDENNHPDSNGYRLNHLDSYDGLFNPFPEKNENIIKFLQSKKSEIINDIKSLEQDISKINKFIVDFQNSLNFVIDSSEIELKGICPMESSWKTKN
jgi:hypothetical protein